MQQCILVYLCCLIISLFGISSSFYIRPMMATEDDIDLDLRLILKGSMLGKLKKRNYDTLQQTLRKHHGYYRYRPDNFIDRLFQMFDRNEIKTDEQFNEDFMMLLDNFAKMESIQSLEGIMNAMNPLNVIYYRSTTKYQYWFTSSKRNANLIVIGHV